MAEFSLPVARLPMERLIVAWKKRKSNSKMNGPMYDKGRRDVYAICAAELAACLGAPQEKERMNEKRKYDSTIARMAGNIAGSMLDRVLVVRQGDRGARTRARTGRRVRPPATSAGSLAACAGEDPVIRLKRSRLPAVDPQADSTGNPSPRDAQSSSSVVAGLMPPSQAWHDIASAPKDGREVIAYQPGGTDENGTSYPATVGTARWRPADDFNPAHWTGPYNPQDYPTHWMPLPCGPR